MGLWIKWDVLAEKDDVIAELSDTAFRAFINVIGEAKQLRNGGRFKSEKHLRQCIGPRLGRAIPALLKSGLLMMDGAVPSMSRTTLDTRWTLRRPCAKRTGGSGHAQNRG
jgi:hypothetical protein